MNARRPPGRVAAVSGTSGRILGLRDRVHDAGQKVDSVDVEGSCERENGEKARVDAAPPFEGPNCADGHDRSRREGLLAHLFRVPGIAQSSAQLGRSVAVRAGIPLRAIRHAVTVPIE